MESYQKRFENLENLHNQMKAVLEWKKLKTEERNRNPSFRLYFHDPSIEQMADLKSQFFSNSIRLRNDLEDKKIKVSNDHRHQLIKQLTTLELQVHYLGSNIRIY